MKSTIGILDMLFKSLAGAVLSLVLVLGSAYAADATGCDDPNNDMINGDFALCSVHAYNIWETENNPDNRDLMREVVAMKTTLITQQMYKQYEQIDSMVRRLKTQLEKATLKNDFKYAGASSDDDSSSSGGDRTSLITGADNCAYKADIKGALDCYEKNLTLLRSLSNDGKEVTKQMKKLLVDDYNGLSKLQVGANNEKCSPAPSDNEKKCDKLEREEGGNKKTMTKKEFEACLPAMAECLRNAKSMYDRAERSSSSGNWNRN